MLRLRHERQYPDTNLQVSRCFGYFANLWFWLHGAEVCFIDLEPVFQRSLLARGLAVFFLAAISVLVCSFLSEVDFVTPGSCDRPLHRREFGAVSDLWANHSTAARPHQFVFLLKACNLYDWFRTICLIKILMCSNICKQTNGVVTKVPQKSK